MFRTILLSASAVVASSSLGLAQDIGNHQLCMIRPDGTGLKQITRRLELRFGAPAISPDGKRIAADCAPARLTVQDTHIVVMDAHGDDMKKLGFGSMPSWSPNGELLAFHTYTPTAAIMVMNVDGSGREEITDHWGSPRWTPGGDNIICLHNDGMFRLIDLRSGKETRLLGAPPGGAYQGFGVSRDGTKLCFGHRALGGLGVATFDSKWQVTDVKTYVRNHCTFCSFSPDGAQIVFSMQLSDLEKSQLYVLDLQSVDPPRRLQEQDADAANVNPQWSPNGEWIIFTSDPPE